MTIELTEEEVNLFREFLLDSMDNAEDDIREAGDEADLVALFTGRRDICSMILSKFGE